MLYGGRVSPNAKAFGYGEHGSLKTDKSYRPFYLIPCPTKWGQSKKS